MDVIEQNNVEDETWVEVEVIKFSDKAILCRLFGKDEWVPKSMVFAMHADQQTMKIELLIPVWLARKKGWY